MVNVSVPFIKIILKYKKFVRKPLLRQKNFGAALRTFLAVKSSKQQFKHGESKRACNRRKTFLRFAFLKKLSPFLNTDSVSKYFMARLKKLSPFPSRNFFSGRVSIAF